MYVRRDRSGLSFGKKRRHTPRWRYALWLMGLVFTAVVIWQFDRVQPKVLHQLGIGPTPTAPTHVHANAGYEAYIAGDLEIAIEEFREAVRQEPRNVDYLYELARLLVWTHFGREAAGQNRVEQAVALADQAIEADPNDPRGYAIKCKALDWAGRPNEGIPFCQEAIDIDPTFAESYGYLGEASADVKRWAVAQEYGEQAVTLNPNSVDAHRDYAFTLSAVGAFEATIQQLEIAVALHPNLLPLQFELARFYRVVDLNENAIGIYDRIRGQDPNNPTVYTELCSAYFEIREDSFAQDFCEQAMELDPNYQPAALQSGMVYYTRRNYESAIEAFNTCACLADGGDCDNDPDTPDAPGTGDYPVECWYLRGLAHYYLAECGVAVPILTRSLFLTDRPEIKSIAYDGLEYCRDSGEVFDWPEPTPTPAPEATPIGL
jgi:tetratricopeptide (TPR) repeat protein